MKTQKQNKDESHGARTRLLKVGIRLFAEKGYVSTSIRELVERAGVTKPVLYYYFNNKEGIFKAILNWAVDLQGGLLSEILETPGTVLERLVYLYRRVFQGIQENQDLSKMIHNLIFGLPQGAPDYDYEQFHQPLIEAIQTIYREGVALGEVREEDPEEVATLALSLIHFCFHMDHLHPKAVDPTRPERLLKLAFRGIAKRESLLRDNQ